MIWRVVATPITPFTSVTKTRFACWAPAGQGAAAAMAMSSAAARYPRHAHKDAIEG